MNITQVAKNRQIKVGDLFFKLGIEPRENSIYPVEFDLKVNTPYGLSPIDVLFTTERQKTLTTYLKNGRRITTSPHHLFKSEEREWKKAEEFVEGDIIETEFGFSEIKKQIKKEKKKVLYDMTVRDVHCYYGNGILNHNSWSSVAIAAHAVKLGYNVNYYTLELGEEYVGKRFDCYFSGYGIEEVNRHRAEVEEIVKGLKGNLIVKEYAPKSASVNTIKAHIQKCKDTEHSPDLIIIDYIDYLKAPSKSRYTERKDEIDDLYVACKGLAKELHIPVISPSQVNRMGAKDNVIEGDKAAGSYDKMMVADICFSLARQKEDKVLGTGRFHIMKNRYGSDGITYDIKIDTNNGHVEFDQNPHEVSPSSSQGPTFNLSREKLESLFAQK